MLQCCSTNILFDIIQQIFSHLSDRFFSGQINNWFVLLVIVSNMEIQQQSSLSYKQMALYLSICSIYYSITKPKLLPPQLCLQMSVILLYKVKI